MKNRKKGLEAVLLFALFFSLLGCSSPKETYVAGAVTQTETVSEVYTEKEVLQKETQPGYVYVCGAVLHPGVYPIRGNMRVFEAIELAGGFSENADQCWLNQADYVADGQKLYVFSKEETQLMSDEDHEEEVSGEDDGKVNINTADKNTLMSLPGIGEAKAEAIISYRRDHGLFQSIEEIQKIPGIKQAVYSKIEDKIKT